MPYNKRKQKCKQSDGTSGSYVLSYTDKKGKKHRACHTSQKKMQGQIAAIEAEADEAYGEEINEDIMRILVKDFISEKVDMGVVNKVLKTLKKSGYKDAILKDLDPDRASTATIDNLGDRTARERVFGVLKDVEGFEVEQGDGPSAYKSIKVNGLKIKLLQGATKKSDEEAEGGYELNEDAIGIFAEHACVQGLGGSSTIETARSDTHNNTATKYDSYDSQGKAIVDAMYEAMADLTSQARGNMPEPGKGVNGNEIVNNSPVDVYLSSGGGIKGVTADVHVKFNDPNRLIGFQRAKAKAAKVYDADLMADASPADGERDVADQFKILRNRFLQNNPDVMDQIAAAVKAAGGPEIGPAPEGVPKIKHLASYSEPDYELDDDGNIKTDYQGNKIQKRVKRGSRAGQLKTKNVELRMLETDVGGQNNRKKFLDYLVKNKIDQGFLNLVKEFFKEEGAPIYFFNYSSSPKPTTARSKYSVGLKVTRMIGKPSDFTIAPRYDDNTTYTFDISYKGQVAFQVETRSSGQGHPPQLKIHPKAKLNKFFAYKEEVFDGSVSIDVPKEQDKSAEKSTSGASKDLKLQPSSKRFKTSEPGIDRRATPEELKRLAAGIQRHAKSIVREILEDQISENRAKLIVEELTGADKSEIKRMIAKEIEGASNKRETKKIFQAEFNRELKKALGTSFIGEPGKINKFVKTAIQKEIEAMFKDKVTQNQIGEITKAVIKKLYRELSYSSVHIVDRIKL